MSNDYTHVLTARMTPAERRIVLVLTLDERRAILLDAARKKAESSASGNIDSQIDSQRGEQQSK